MMAILSDGVCRLFDSEFEYGSMHFWGFSEYSFTLFISFKLKLVVYFDETKRTFTGTFTSELSWPLEIMFAVGSPFGVRLG